MEITTVEGYILSKLFEAEARAENLEAELIAKTAQAEAGMRSVQRLVDAIKTHKEHIKSPGHPDHELWNVLEATDQGISLIEDPTQEMSEPTVEMPTDYWTKP